MYHGISRYYDEIFVTHPDEMRFSLSLMGDRRRLLDIGCGTGSITRMFAASGREISAVDLDEGMVARAVALNADAALHFERLDMTRIAERFGAAAFDGALCFGNTLVHLNDPERLNRFLADLRGVLSPGGLSLIQILNYARILDRGISELPLIETPQLRFTRRYEPQGPLLRFETRLEHKDTGEVIADAVNLLPLRPEELESGLRRAGFSSVTLYGDFSGGPLLDDSFLVLAAAQ